MWARREFPGADRSLHDRCSLYRDKKALVPIGRRAKVFHVREEVREKWSGSVTQG
jgi:hypothetical protein